MASAEHRISPDLILRVEWDQAYKPTFYKNGEVISEQEYEKELREHGRRR